MWILRAPVRTQLLQQGSKLGPQGTTKGLKMGNVWSATKHKRTLCDFLRALIRIRFLSQGSKLRPQGTNKGTHMENAWWIKNRNDFYANFGSTCQDQTFAARIQVGTPRDSQRNENRKCLMGKKKHKQLLSNVCVRLSGSHFCTKDPSWDPKGQPWEWKW